MRDGNLCNLMVEGTREHVRHVKDAVKEILQEKTGSDAGAPRALLKGSHTGKLFWNGICRPTPFWNYNA